MKRVIRVLYSLTGGSLKKKEVSSSSANFKIVINDKEKISADYEYKFVRGKSGIVSNSV